MSGAKVVLIVDVQNIVDKDIFEKHLKREGLKKVDNEDFAYEGEAHTHIFNTRAYILDVVSKGLSKTNFDNCKIIFQIGENPIEAYIYEKMKKEFRQAEI